MKSFKKILFLADGSKSEKAVLARAARLAVANRARLTIFDAVDTEGYTARGSAESIYGNLLDAFMKERIGERCEELGTLKKAVEKKEASLRVGVRVETGSKARMAIRTVLLDRYDLVVKAAQGGDDTIKYLFGSTDRTLMRKCPCPVWIVKPTRKRRFKKILAAVDVSPVDPAVESLAERVLSLATAFAKEENSELHVLHAWRLAGEYKMRGRQIYASKVDEIVSELREAHRSELDALLKRHPYEPRIVHLVKGRAGSLIPQAVEELGVDLVVMGTVGRTGVPGLVIGNTAETVLGSVDCSVLTLKPEGFESPLEP